MIKIRIEVDKDITNKAVDCSPYVTFGEISLAIIEIERVKKELLDLSYKIKPIVEIRKNHHVP